MAEALYISSRGKYFLVPAQQIFADLPLDEGQGGDKEVYIDAVIERAKQLLGR